MRRGGTHGRRRTDTDEGVLYTQPRQVFDHLENDEVPGQQYVGMLAERARLGLPWLQWASRLGSGRLAGH